MITDTNKQSSVLGPATVDGKLGTYATVKLSKKTGLVFLAWQHGGYWTTWHIANKDDLTKVKCSDSPGKKDQVNTTDRVKLSDLCTNCVMNLRRELK